MLTTHPAIQQSTDAAHVVHADAEALLTAISVDPTLAPSPALRRTDVQRLRMSWTADPAGSDRLHATWIAA